MNEITKYLQSYFLENQPFNKTERRYSSLILGLKNARLISNREQETKKVTLKIKAPLAPSNWGAAIIYLIVLELIGTCFRPKDKRKVNGNPIYKALRYFTSHSENEARAIESLRHSFAHNYGLINLQNNRETKVINKRGTHHFSLTANPIEKLITERTEFWDGRFETRNKKNVTRINLWKLGDLVENVFNKLVEENNKENIELILDNGIEELKAKYTVII